MHFLSQNLSIEAVNNRRCHEFKCAAPQCKGKGSNRRIVRRFLDKGDAKSTSNLRKNAEMCWGEQPLEGAVDGKDIDSICATLAEAKTGPTEIQDFLF